MEFLFQGPKRKDAHRLDGMLLSEEARVSTSSPCAEPGKVQTRSFWSFHEKLKMRAFELFHKAEPFPEPGKVQTHSFWSFQLPKSSKCARLNFSQGRTSLEKFKRAHFGVFSLEKLRMCAFELSPRPNPSPSLEKFKRAHFGVFSPRKAQNARV